MDDTTRYDYYTDATPAHRPGDLWKTTNALGHATTFDAYDAHGHPTLLHDPNGLDIRLAYDARGRLASRSVGGESATYAYDAVGNLAKATLPDGSSSTYAYDPAHRLTDITDALGNHIHYTLDAAGNRIQEDVYDAAGTLAKTQRRVFDALSRLAQDIGAYNQTARYDYDAGGNLTRQTDPLGHASAYAYDALNRITQQTDALQGVTAFGYDAQGNLATVTDPRNLATLYRYDGLGNRTQTASPDTKTTQGSHDSAGNLRNAIDARGKQMAYSYDALNRLTQARFAGGQIDYAYDQGSNGIGRLTQVTDGSGSTRWNYDAHGRIIRTTRQIVGFFGTAMLVTRHAYDNAGRLASITYPSGKTVRLGYDANGQIAGLDADGTPLLGNIAHQPFGAASAWTWGHGGASVRRFDQDGRQAAYPLGGRVRQLAYDLAGRITGYTDTDPAHGQSFAYDSLGRMLTAYDANGTDGYRYDANGNRTGYTRNGLDAPFALAADSNRLLGSGGPAPKTYSHDLAGNVLGDGVNRFTYDGRGLLAQAQNAWGIALYLVNGLGRRVAKLTGGSLDMAGDADRDGQLTVADMRIIALMAQGKAAANPAADCDHSGTIALQDALCVQAKINGLRDNPQRYAQDALLFAYDEAGRLIGEYTPAGQAVREIVYLDGKPVVVFSGGKDYFIDTDHLGTPRAITDSTGVVVWRWDSDAFGTAPPDEDPDGDGVRFTFPLRFPGQYFDAETGLHYNMARYYAPWLGRYLQADPIGLAGGVNLYGYVRGDPVDFVDPLGLAPDAEPLCATDGSQGITCTTGMRPPPPGTPMNGPLSPVGTAATAAGAAAAVSPLFRAGQMVVRGGLTIEAGGQFSASEIAAAKYMAAQGRNVFLRQPVGTRAGGDTSDLLVDGIRYDVYTPQTANPNRIISSICSKNSQAEGIVLDLGNTKVTPEQLGDVLKRVQGAGATNIRDVVIMGK